ncbi:MAG TPA: hypothetical protein VFG27_15305 [Pseudomonadales bacterium]|nr:hypothetical protein [Pseudomonadales bacterium]
MRGFGITRGWGIGVALAGVVLATAGFGAGWGIALAQHVHRHGASEGPGWLVALKPDGRIPAIQRQLRGFETTMAEVSYRYNEMYFAGVEGNWDYAAHMAMTLEHALRLGLERNPSRKANAENLFLKGSLPQVLDAIKKKDAALFKQRIEAMRAACTACHAAENHAFIRIGVPTAKRNPVE